MLFRKLVVPFLLLVPVAALSGCLAPEHCQGCLTALAALSDGGASDVPDSAIGGTGGTGGTPVVGTGGAIGSGGVPGTGGQGTGGQAGSGGLGTGGVAGTGGAGTGGAGTGGAGTGGAGTGGAGTGGVAGGGVGGTNTGGQGTGGAGGNTLNMDLVLWYKFDETTGTVATNSAMPGGTASNAMLGTAGTGGTATFSTATKQVGTGALSLTRPGTTLPTATQNGGYAILPSLQMVAPTATTISVWVNLPTGTLAWERIFDFGFPTGGMVPVPANMYLTARAADGTMAVRFSITTTGNLPANEQRLDGTTPLSPGAWHHIVVVLQAGSPYTGRMYINGAMVGMNAAMTLHPMDLGATTNNWIGRSKYMGNPYLNGFIDDFRVYRRALAALEIAELFTLR